MSLDDMFQQARGSGAVEIEQGWRQGRATFGGLIGGLLLAAIKGALGSSTDSSESTTQQQLRSITISFVAPGTPGAAQVSAQILRRGSNVTQTQATLTQNGEVVAVALASFGKHRDSTIDFPYSSQMPDLPAPNTLDVIPEIPDLTPEFFQNVSLRIATGDVPFSGGNSPSMSGWMALRHPGSTFAEEHFVTLVDAWPPAVIQLLSAPAPASSLTWTLEFVGELDNESADSIWGYDVHTDIARDGYAHSHATVWRPDGTLVAISRQTIAVFG